jgi:hypothetical protein
VADDQPRLLHRHSEYGYTDRLSRAMTVEPKAVHRQTQAGLTEQAARRDAAHRRQRFQELLRRLLGDLKALRSEFPQVSKEARSIRRELDRASRALDGG